MEFGIEKKISNFVEGQFPDFYKREGPNFILFVKAYYEWLESSDQAIYHARRLFEYGDVDETLDEFLDHFNEKYLFGIPYDIISNKRFLIKHILDVYRTKGTIHAYKLIFKLIYDEDVEVYIPGKDVLRVSDGRWKEPKYLEVTDSDYSLTLPGKTIIGASSRTTAVVEAVTREIASNNVINVIYITNITPPTGEFSIGEKITEEGQDSNTSIVNQASILLGSLGDIEIVSSSPGFSTGVTLKVFEG